MLTLVIATLPKQSFYKSFVCHTSATLLRISITHQRLGNLGYPPRRRLASFLSSTYNLELRTKYFSL